MNQIVNSTGSEGQRAYTFDQGGGIGGLLAMKQDGNVYYYLYDGKGNVTALTDSSGNVVATYTYNPFGVLTESSGIDQPFRFSTKRYDEDTGLSYYGYRFYSASLGRWITRDPLGEAGGVNLYGFVGNNAINGVDPLGLKLNYTNPMAKSRLRPFEKWLQDSTPEDSVLREMITALKDSEIDFYVHAKTFGKSRRRYTKVAINVQDMPEIDTEECRKRTTIERMFLHELAHLYEYYILGNRSPESDEFNMYIINTYENLLYPIDGMRRNSAEGYY